VRFHVLGIPHTATNKDYTSCAFTQKVVTLCQMLKMRGHYVIHYGNAASRAWCDEQVNVTAMGEVLPPDRIFEFNLQASYYRTFTTNAIAGIRARAQPNDFLLCPFGAGHSAIGQAFPQLLVVESGIGYSGGFFAPFKVFESYAMLHAYYGTTAVQTADKFRWYEVVIPNAYDPADFTFGAEKDDYLLFLGMRHGGIGKGIRVAADAAAEAGRKLIVAGPGALPDDLPGDIEHAGLVGVEQRRQLLTRAAALLAPSIFLEPFCGAQVESFLSGTPVISTDWGSFGEYNVHGITGFRCRTHSEFVWAIQNIKQIGPYACRKWGENFTIERVSRLYDEYFRSVYETRVGKGWYEPHPERTDLETRKMLI
jgi:glycosyltransferase involved in cell wall biosynthesis